MKRKSAKRPPLTAAEKKAREELRASKKGELSRWALQALGNRGPGPVKHTEEFLNQVACDLEEWSKLDSSHFLTQFCLDYKVSIDKDEIQELSKEHKVLGRAWKNANLRTTMRLHEKSLQGDVDSKFWAKIMPLKDEEYRNWRITELKIEAEGGKDKNINLFLKPGIGLGHDPQPDNVIEYNPKEGK